MVLEGLVDFIRKNYNGKIVEVGCGTMFRVAEKLRDSGFEVVCVDVKAMNAPRGIIFYQDDVNNPKIEIYKNASVIYSIRPPYELYTPLMTLSKKVCADCIIKPLYGEIPENFRLVNNRGDYFYIMRVNY